jgi:y4mF family transcriptional regulator
MFNHNCTRKGTILRNKSLLYPIGYNLSKLSEFVKKRRKQAKLTQQEAARKAGVGLRFIRDLEQGKSALRLDKVNQVLDLFGHEVGPVGQRDGK